MPSNVTAIINDPLKYSKPIKVNGYFSEDGEVFTVTKCLTAVIESNFLDLDDPERRNVVEEMPYPPGTRVMSHSVDVIEDTFGENKIRTIKTAAYIKIAKDKKWPDYDPNPLAICTD